MSTISRQHRASGDWHPADIVAALRKAGWTLRKLARAHGYKHSSVLSKPLHDRWPKGQRLIAEAIGVPPETIWPSRYLDAPKHAKGKAA